MGKVSQMSTSGALSGEQQVAPQADHQTVSGELQDQFQLLAAKALSLQNDGIFLTFKIEPEDTKIALTDQYKLEVQTQVLAAVLKGDLATLKVLSNQHYIKVGYNVIIKPNAATVN
jgi:hypothetical protein